MPTPTTRAGYEKLLAEMEHLEQVQLPLITQRLADARAEGDLKENTEYHSQRENQGMVQAKINLLKSKLADSYIMESSESPGDEIVFGRKVTLENLDDGEEEMYQLVGPGEEDYNADVMKILVDSPMGKQLLNHKVGDEIAVETPGGEMKFKVLAVDQG